MLWLPTVLLRSKCKLFNIPTYVLLGINGSLNNNVSFGNTWVRGFSGWKNDFCIYNDFLWVFEPNFGCKFALPENSFSNSSIHCGVTFPAFIYNDRKLFKDINNFRPKPDGISSIEKIFGKTKETGGSRRYLGSGHIATDGLMSIKEALGGVRGFVQRIVHQIVFKNNGNPTVKILNINRVTKKIM